MLARVCGNRNVCALEAACKTVWLPLETARCSHKIWTWNCLLPGSRNPTSRLRPEHEDTHRCLHAHVHGGICHKIPAKEATKGPPTGEQVNGT